MKKLLLMILLTISFSEVCSATEQQYSTPIPENVSISGPMEGIITYIGFITANKYINGKVKITRSFPGGVPIGSEVWIFPMQAVLPPNSYLDLKKDAIIRFTQLKFMNHRYYIISPLQIAKKVENEKSIFEKY